MMQVTVTHIDKNIAKRSSVVARLHGHHAQTSAGCWYTTKQHRCSHDPITLICMLILEAAKKKSSLAEYTARISTAERKRVRRTRERVCT